MTHPSVIELIKILLSVAPSTISLERSYIKPSKICCKDRNALEVSTMEKLYMLSAINNPDIDLDTTMTYQEKKKS